MYGASVPMTWGHSRIIKKDLFFTSPKTAIIQEIKPFL
jgi:hypothetical protein